MGKLLIIAGVVLIVAGVLIHFADKSTWLGKLPGDFRWEGRNFKVFAPITTSIIISIVLSLLLYVINKLRNP